MPRTGLRVGARHSQLARSNRLFSSGQSNRKTLAILRRTSPRAERVINRAASETLLPDPYSYAYIHAVPRQLRV